MRCGGSRNSVIDANLRRRARSLHPLAREFEGELDRRARLSGRAGQDLARGAPDAIQPRAIDPAALEVPERALGERGPVWWSDDEPDYTQCKIENTPYAEWYRSLQEASE